MPSNARVLYVCFWSNARVLNVCIIDQRMYASNIHVHDYGLLLCVCMCVCACGRVVISSILEAYDVALRISQ